MYIKTNHNEVNRKSNTTNHIHESNKGLDFCPLRATLTKKNYKKGKNLSMLTICTFINTQLNLSHHFPHCIPDAINKSCKK